MMNSVKKLVIAIVVLLTVTIASARIKNAITQTVKIYGNCIVSKVAIEKAGNLKNVATVTWNKDTGMATLTYDQKKTNPDEILKRIALAGYDNEKFLAPDSAYSSLPDGCRYTRDAKIPVKAVPKTTVPDRAKTESTSEQQEVNPLQAVYDYYFSVKDALVKTDSKTAGSQSKELLTALTTVKMEALKMEVHQVWMSVWKDITADAKGISETNDITKQRNLFKSLSKNIYQLLKVAKPTEAVYYQYCPMQDANWLSKENAVKNPYYGNQMLTCGKVVETIK